jgi:hypothetical protein
LANLDDGIYANLWKVQTGAFTLEHSW